ncbi:transcription initiation factor TFIID subunit 9-like [Acyrthosiphon pisum]|uniref:Transcription initiation factor TFIID subunit 9 n=1 Tax=Acyrthosiphon pisum TaxID=7029 RepID=A0A8R2AA18_ACYPI|nr:transcription initiation factor TFIID subunit 9-like [Acyrthosiphon pisum]|eukprot:XP_003243079.1 PREDICTED: transcription initiation factor TFIID subunit 9-like [Acyrthosiphon pisum]
MESTEGKNNMPKDSQIIVSMMEDLGIVEYDQQVLNHFLEFNYRYTTQLLEDAKALSNSAEKKNVDADDVKLAIQMAQGGVFPGPPPRKVLTTAAIEVNKMPLPPQRHASQLRISHDSPNSVKTKYRLRYESPVCSGENMPKDNKTTAAEMLAESRRL